MVSGGRRSWEKVANCIVCLIFSPLKAKFWPFATWALAYLSYEKLKVRMPCWTLPLSALELKEAHYHPDAMWIARKMYQVWHGRVPYFFLILQHTGPFGSYLPFAPLDQIFCFDGSFCYLLETCFCRMYPFTLQMVRGFLFSWILGVVVIVCLSVLRSFRRSVGSFLPVGWGITRSLLYALLSSTTFPIPD